MPVIKPDGPMRVVLVVERFDPQAGGLEQWTVALARFLAGQGHEVHVASFAAAAHDLPVQIHLANTAHGDVAAPRGVAARARRLACVVARLVATLGNAVVHDTGFGWSADVFQPQTGSRLLSQARLVATHRPLRRLRAAVSPVSLAWRWQMAQLERRQLHGARHVVAVSRLVRDQLCAQYGLDADRLAVIPNGVDTARFAPALLAPLRAAARAALGVGDATMFLVSARNMHLKGVDVAMRALAPLAAAGREAGDVRLVIAGAAPDAQWLGLAARLGLGDRIVFAGDVARMEPLFAAADVLVHPTRWDACSLSTIEAAAAGLPVVTTAMNGAAELIAHGRTGFVLTAPEDHAALSATLRGLLDPVLRRRIGTAALAAAQAHDSRANFRAVEAMLLQAAASRRAVQAAP